MRCRARGLAGANCGGISAIAPWEIAMPMNYFTMWGLLILMALGAAGELVAHGDLLGSVRDAYPSDMAEREALNRCGLMDEAFSRFSASDRENCYRTIIHTAASSNDAGG
jgi:hypothetical protein